MTSRLVSYDDARNMMVDSQVRPNKVTDSRILAAMRSLPRERFVPAGMASLAYADEDVPLGGGRYLMEPMLIARLVQAAVIRRGERALVLGAGCGYGAALLAKCGAEVVALESDEKLVARAQDLLAELAPEVRLVTGPLASGCPQHAPYDVVLIDGAFEELPAAVPGQLRRPGGRLVGIRMIPGGPAVAVLGEVVGGAAGLALQPVFDAATPLIPELARVPGFVF